jgi:hypothetical protein
MIEYSAQPWYNSEVQCECDSEITARFFMPADKVGQGPGGNITCMSRCGDGGREGRFFPTPRFWSLESAEPNVI